MAGSSPQAGRLERGTVRVDTCVVDCCSALLGAAAARTCVPHTKMHTQTTYKQAYLLGHAAAGALVRRVDESTRPLLEWLNRHHLTLPHSHHGVSCEVQLLELYCQEATQVRKPAARFYCAYICTTCTSECTPEITTRLPPHAHTECFK